MGIPEGLRISIGGAISIIAEKGASISVDYETHRLRDGEAFLIFINGEEMLKETAQDKDEKGFSAKKITTRKTFEM